MARQGFVEREVIRTLLRDERTTRRVLVEQLGVRPATLIETVRRQSQKGLLSEPERKGKKTGRRGSPICINKDFASFVGVNVEVDRTDGVLIDAQGNMQAYASVASDRTRDADARKEEAVQVIGRLRREAGSTWSKVRGIGFADPGIVDMERGVSLKAVNVPGWRNIPTREWLSEKYSKDCLVVGQCQGQAFAEYVTAKTPPEESLFFLQLDFGVGGGFVQEGRLRPGDTYSGMEIGHVIVQNDGPLCQCGNRGCLESVAGVVGVRRRVEELRTEGVETALTAGEFSIEHFIACVTDGDKAAGALALEISEYVGAALSMVVALLNPSLIVVGGRLSGIGEVLLTTVQRVLSLRCLPLALEKLTCRISALPAEAAALGAAYLIREKILLHEAAA